MPSSTIFARSLQLRMFVIVCATTFSFAVAFGYFVIADQWRRGLWAAEAQLGTTADRQARAIRERLRTLASVGARANSVFCNHLSSHPQSGRLVTYPRDADGAIRFRRPGQSQAVFVSRSTSMTPQLSWLLEESEPVWTYLGPMVTGHFMNFYFDTPLGTHRSTSVDWVRELDADHDFRRDVFHASGDPEHDPQRRPVWTPVYYDSIHGKWMTTLVVPLYCGGAFLGTTASDFDLDALFETVRTLYLREGLGKAFIFDDEGNLIVHPDYMDRVRRSHGPMNAGLRLDQIDDPALAEFMQSYSRTHHDRRALRYGPSDNATVIVSRPIGIRGWHLGFYESESRLVEPLRHLRARMVVGAILTVMLLAVTMYFALAKLVLSRLRWLGEAAEQVARGEIDPVRLRPIRDSRDEVGNVVQAFQSMVGDLGGLVSRLSREVTRLGASERNFRAILDGMNDAIFVHDVVTGEILDVNAKVTELYGYERDVVMTKTVGELSSDTPPYTTTEAIVWMQKAREGAPQLFEWRAKDHDGCLFWVEVNMRLADINGALRILVSVRDVTARKRAEADLRATREYLRYILNSLPFAVVAFRRDGRITHWNSEAARFTKIAESDAMDTEIWQGVPFLAKHAGEIDRVRTTHVSSPRKTWETIGEAQRCLILSFFVMPDEAYGDVALRIEDVTDLERKEDLLRTMQRMDTVGMLAGGLAHDFNNDITCVSAILETWNDKLSRATAIDRAKLSEGIATMLESCRRAAQTIQQLRRLSQGDEFTLHPIDLNAPARDVADLCRRSFDRAIEIDFEPFPEPAMALANESQLGQVLLNLCVNASHAMTTMRPPGTTQGGIMRVAIERISAESLSIPDELAERALEYWAIRICDTGVGMDAETKERLFVPFFTTKGKIGGTGLGLSMAYRVMRQHGGFIDVASVRGTGSTFSVYVPVRAITG